MPEIKASTRLLVQDSNIFVHWLLLVAIAFGGHLLVVSRCRHASEGIELRVHCLRVTVTSISAHQGREADNHMRDS
jgi:hypothetical protein